MSAVFVDTSALVALFNSRDDNYPHAVRAFATLRARQAPLVSTSFVLVETYALVGRRFGLNAVALFRSDFEPLLDVVWVDALLHNRGLDLLIARQRRSLSVVDAVSFVTMRDSRINEAFAFDSDFEQEGFRPVE